MAILFTSQSFCQKSDESKSPKNTFCISFWYLAWDSNPGFSSNKPTHYLLDHGDFNGPSIALNLNHRSFSIWQYLCMSSNSVTKFSIFSPLIDLGLSNVGIYWKFISKTKTIVRKFGRKEGSTVAGKRIFVADVGETVFISALPSNGHARTVNAP